MSDDKPSRRRSQDEWREKSKLSSPSLAQRKKPGSGPSPRSKDKGDRVYGRYSSPPTAKPTKIRGSDPDGESDQDELDKIMAYQSSGSGANVPAMDLGSRTTQSTTSRMMKTTGRNRPFTKDTHDLFATLIVSLELTTHRQLFKTYPNSFTTDEAAENLSALKFSQSNRAPDPREPSRVITTTTTTTFSMSREMAKGICQHFMDARLIENAADLSSTTFKDKGFYVITPKGLHILERFITKNGINGEHLLKVFATQPICMKLLHLERRLQDDELLINRGVLEVIFRRFVGRQPNYRPRVQQQPPPSQQPPSSEGAVSEFDRTMGIEMHDMAEKAKSGGAKAIRTIKHTFGAIAVLEWLCDFTTICGRDEAAELAAHFVRLKFIEIVQDQKRKDGDNEGLVQVQGEDGVGGVSQGEFRCHIRAVYGVTEWGRTVARWPGYSAVEQGQTSSFQSREQGSSLNEGIGGGRLMGGGASPMGYGIADDARSSSSQQGIHGLPSSTYAHQTGTTDGAASSTGFRSPSTGSLVDDVGGLRSAGASSVAHKASASEHLRGEFLRSRHDSGANDDFPGATINTRDSNSKRLRQILEEPALRSMFRDFLKQNFCEENLSFWLDVQDFKRRFHTTSSAVAVRSGDGGGSNSKSDSGSRGGGMVSAVRKLGGRSNTQSNANEHSAITAMERHQRDLIGMAFVIYNTYLAPSSTCELNIEHNMRSELVSYMSKLISDAKTGEGLNQVDAKDVHKGASDASNQLEERRRAVSASMPRAPLHASQLQTMVRLYERIQDHIFRLMATDSVPRFIKDPRFLSLVRSVEEYTEALEAGRIDPTTNAGPGLGKSVVDAMELNQSKPPSMIGNSNNHHDLDSPVGGEAETIEALRDESAPPVGSRGGPGSSSSSGGSHVGARHGK